MGYGKRGMELEEIIEFTNNAYKNKGLALVDKVPTDWTVHYDKKQRKVIYAYPNKKGLVDFLGISHGRSIAFDTKSTNSRTSFPLNNIEKHQMEYLLKHKDQGGISFFIIEFAKHLEHYFLPIDKANEWWENMKNGGRKSIPYEWFVYKCDLIKSGHGVPLDYLKQCGTVY
ncbi:Holliday junction resolvase RecU [Gracilibacillus thailandensis]|uniref:Holliday junction resolvase RecU n=1 Tax=Gracilibacillus thailandensis TaxID=563735 RepID=A0A6N7QW08_9BACI|nr:Holliday junction resolvase RecU [Gracilibacillus thailandensis]MRI66198.1 Holliday junction resolvase RecU [Gracilibacillus thailandensis]